MIVFRQCVLIALIFLWCFGFPETARSKVTYRLLNTEPVLNTVNYRSSKDRLLFHLYNRICKQRTGKSLLKNWTVAYRGTQYYLYPTANHFRQIYREYKALRADNHYNPSAEIFAFLAPKTKLRAFLLRNFRYPGIELYRVYATHFNPLKLIPDYQLSSDGHMAFNADNCVIKLYSGVREFVKNPKTDLLIETEDILSLGTEDIKDKNLYKSVGHITDDTMVIFDFGDKVAASDAFIATLAYGLLGHRQTYRTERFLPAFDFVPPFLAEHQPIRLNAGQHQKKSVKIWRRNELFKQFLYPKIMVPNYLGLKALIKEISDRLQRLYGMSPEIDYVSMHKFVGATPDMYDLRLNIINFDTPELVNIWKKTAMENSDSVKLDARSTNIDSFLLTRLSDTKIRRLYKNHLPLYRVSYPLYKRINP